MTVGMIPNTRYVTFEQMVQAAFVGDGTSVVDLEPARINQETETREIGREDTTICYRPSNFYKLDTKNNKYKVDME